MAGDPLVREKETPSCVVPSGFFTRRMRLE
jgi:hypothetical protein